MVELAVSIDGAASAAYTEALKMYAESLGKDIATAPRRAAILMCRNFGAATKEADKTRPVKITPFRKNEDNLPPWITRSDGRKLRPPKRFVRIDLPERGGNQNIRRYLKGADAERWQKEAERGWGRLYRFGANHPTGTRGLAKRSWGWVMHNIFNGAAPDTPWQRRKNDRRSPKDATKESTSTANPGTTLASGYARICNRLDYIKNALTISEDEIINKAARSLVEPIFKKKLRKEGVSPSDIRSLASAAAHEFTRMFGN